VNHALSRKENGNAVNDLVGISTPLRPAGRRHDPDLVVDADYTFKISNDFLRKLLEVVGGKAALQYEGAVTIFTRNVFESQIWVVPQASFG
jgi:hypothetical protein